VEPPIDAIYSSPFYRCLQTVEPAAEHIKLRWGHEVKIRAELGVGYGASL
jgi:transcription factor C subunit 7